MGKRILYVAGRRIEVSEAATGKDVLDTLGEGKNRQVVIQKPDGNQEVVPQSKRIHLKDGETLDTMPTWTLG